MQLTITDVRSYHTKKDGSALIDRKGNPYIRTQIKTIEKGNEMLSGFVYQELKVGDVIEAKVETETYQGQPQLRFSIAPNMQRVAAGAENTSAVLAELKSQTAMLREIENSLSTFINGLTTEKLIADITSPKVPEPETDVFPDDDLPGF